MKRIIIFLLFVAMASGTGVCQAQELYFPPLSSNQWDVTTPESMGWCVDQIDTLYSFLESHNTMAFLVLKDGKMVLEKYFGSFNSDSLWYWASAGKTLTAMLTGIAQEEGYLNLDSAASKYMGVGWTSCPVQKERLITVRNQLATISGLDDAAGDPDCTTPACLQYLADAGTRWAYHNAPYTKLGQVISSATGMDFNTYFNLRIRNKIGMNGFWYDIDYNHIYFSNARSMARYGLLLLAKGKWDNIRILNDTAYFTAMTNSSQNLNKSYGYLTWLNGKSSYMLPQSQFIFTGSLCPSAPADMFSAMGKNGQLINVVPGQGLLVIRMGNASGDPFELPNAFNNTIWDYLNNVMCNTHGIPEQADKTDEFNIFPNPASSDIFIFPNHNTQDYKALLYDIHGMLRAEVESAGKINVSNLPPGIYMLEIVQNEIKSCYTISIVR
ncbi:MAG: serine hydrolase [Bacteroidota bacterium]